VEHTRAHPRLSEQAPPGKREKLDVGTLYLPDRLPSRAELLVFFHGDPLVAELAGQKNHVAVVSAQVGEGSGVYQRLFTADPHRFPRLVKEAETKANRHFTRVILGGWSAGCGALRQILKDPESYALVNSVICIDGVHTDYVSGAPGPLESAEAGDRRHRGQQALPARPLGDFPGHLRQHHRDRGLPGAASRRAHSPGAEVGADGHATTRRSRARQIPDARIRRHLCTRPRGRIAIPARLAEVAALKRAAACHT